VGRRLRPVSIGVRKLNPTREYNTKCPSGQLMIAGCANESEFWYIVAMRCLEKSNADSLKNSLMVRNTY